MLITEKEKLDEFLTKTAAALDIPDYVYEDATLKYEDVGIWLAAEDSELKRFLPEIYPQGSFRLGTVVQPITDKDEYDIDLVCHLELNKEQTTQKNLKQIIGDRLKKREDLAKILQASRRCWTLDYPPESQLPQFHMDVLPSIPNRERPPTGILLTDTELTHWQKSNPKAYADWFYERMKVIFRGKREAIAKSILAEIEDVPEWQVKTPLQIAIQILKRHRDIHFQNDKDDRPVSVIITTLAAHAYRNQVDIYEALTDIVRDMPGFIEKRNGQWWVANPVDPEENFADKWNEYPARREAFYRWLGNVQADFTLMVQKQTLNEAVDSLIPALGERTMTKVAGDLGLKRELRFPVALISQIQVPALGDTRHCQSPVWLVQERYKASISGSVHKVKKGKKLWNLTSRPVPKNVWLRFALITNTPPPFEVQWQVVNTGQEATKAGQLRGDFYKSDESGDTLRWETTKYRGTHWVEGYVIKNGMCVAKTGRKTVQIR